MAITPDGIREHGQAAREWSAIPVSTIVTPFGVTVETLKDGTRLLTAEGGGGMLKLSDAQWKDVLELERE